VWELASPMRYGRPLAPQAGVLVSDFLNWWAKCAYSTHDRRRAIDYSHQSSKFAQICDQGGRGRWACVGGGVRSTRRSARAGSHADVDDEIEAVLRKQLLELLPARWLGEETGACEGAGGPYCWLVDPHDGTSAFLAGERGSAVSIALLRDSVPVLGVVHSPLSADRGPDTIAWAEGLDHLLRNGVAVAPVLADATLSKGAIVFVSQAAPEWPVGNAQAVAPARFVALPSIAYRLARVAAGDGVAAVSLNGPCGWDYAAGHALLRGAGGVLLDQTGRDVTYTVDGSSNTRMCGSTEPRSGVSPNGRSATFA
jgi:fructose-1,6-bisphosphatase/inositol monophosphatase family enzyme